MYAVEERTFDAWDQSDWPDMRRSMGTLLFGGLMWSSCSWKDQVSVQYHAVYERDHSLKYVLKWIDIIGRAI